MIKPTTRREMFLNAIATGCECELEPVTREEAILAAHAKREASGGSGGSGGGGASNVCVVTIRPVDFGSEGGEYTCDKTHAELVAAWQAGIPVIVVRNMGAYHAVLKSIQWYGNMSGSTEAPFIIPADEQGMYSFQLRSDNTLYYMSNE